MSKIIGAGIFLKRKILAIVVALIVFILQNKNPAVADTANSADNIQGGITKEDNLPDVQKTGEWAALKKRWDELKKTAFKPAGSIEGEIEKQKQLNNRHLQPLIAKGYFSKNAGFILNYVYGELLYHKIRLTSGMTCYKMTVMGGNLSAVRSDLESRIKVLAEISQKGVISQSVFLEAKGNIARDIEFMSRSEKLFEKGSNTQYGQEYRDEEKALVNLFKSGKVDESVKADEDAAKAAELIIKLNSKAGMQEKNKSNTLNGQLSNFSEWKLIKSNWRNVSQIGGVEFGSIEKIIAEKKNTNRPLLNKIVQAGIITADGAKIFNDIYGDRIYHRLRPMAATCYEPTILGMKQQLTRDDFENRIKELEEISKRGVLGNDVLKQAEINLQKDMEMVLLINELFGTENQKQVHPDEKEILSYFIERHSPVADGKNDDNINDTLAVRKSVKEAMAVIRLIYTD